MTARQNLDDASGPERVQPASDTRRWQYGPRAPKASADADAWLGPDEIDQRALLATRSRAIAASSFVVLVVFAGLDPLIAPAAHSGLYWLKIPSLFASAALWHWAPRIPSYRGVVAATMANLFLFQALVAPMTIFVGIGWHALATAGAFALGAAAVFPWGLRMQLWLTAGLVPLGLIPIAWLGLQANWVFPIACAVSSLLMACLVAHQNDLYHRAIRERLRAFRENVEHLRQLTEHIRGVFWLSERGGALLYVSPRFEEIWGQSRQRLTQRPDAWLEPVHSDDRETVAAWARAQGVGGQDTCEYRLLARPDARPRWIRDGVFPITGTDGRPWRIARFSLDVTGEKEEEQERQMQSLARRTQAAIEDERKRFARDLHDDLGQSLTGIKLMLTSTPLQGADAARIGHCASEIDRAMASLRAMIHALRPPLLDELGLVAALSSHCTHVTGPAGVRCTLSLPDESVAFAEEEKTAIFRIVQEALTNVIRHSGAQSVALRLTVEDDAGIHLAIEDDGRGLAAGREDFGLRGMRERAALLNGELTVEQRPQGGTAVRLRLPRTAASADRSAVPA